jgi:transcriptional regulator with XRE-family HTH domain
MNNLRAFRVKKLMTQKDLAKASGVSQVTISFIENGLSEPMDLTKQKLARALKVEPEKLFPPKIKKGTKVTSF